MYSVFLTPFFPSKPWLINYTLAAHGRQLMLKCAVSFDWTHESHTGFISSGWRSSSRTRSPLRIFTDDLQAHFHSRQLLPRHFLRICAYTSIPPCKRQKGANRSCKQTETAISVQVPPSRTAVQGLQDESVKLSIIWIFIQQTPFNWGETQFDDMGM